MGHSPAPDAARSARPGRGVMTVRGTVRQGAEHCAAPGARAPQIAWRYGGALANDEPVAPTDLEQELARRDALGVAESLADRPAQDDAAARIRLGAMVLREWSTDAEIRRLLRPLFAASVPDQRALIALGDIDTWLPDGRAARGWWEQAAAGPDPELAAVGAWRAARARLRGGCDGEALPLLQQADAAGIAAASLALGRTLEKRGEDEAAADALRRSRTDEGMLRLAEIRLRADDLDGAEHEIARLSPPPGSIPGSVDLHAWEKAVRGEIAFRRGLLEAAEDWLSEVRGAPGDRDRHVELRLAQIAIATAAPVTAYLRIRALAAGCDAAAEHARLLMTLHRDLLDEGAARIEQED